MPFYAYDDRTKDRKTDEAAIEAFLSEGGEIKKIPNSKKMSKLRRQRAAARKTLQKDGFEEILNLNDF